jgi:hypothetical protein
MPVVASYVPNMPTTLTRSPVTAPDKETALLHSVAALPPMANQVCGAVEPVVLSYAFVSCDVGAEVTPELEVNTQPDWQISQVGGHSAAAT